MACSKDDAPQDQPVIPARRTVVVYMSGENNLSPYLSDDLYELKIGRQRVGQNERLVVFVDRQSTTEKPFLALVTTDNRLDTLYRYEEAYSSDPARMADVLTKAIALCPATEDYGLVFWGHANSWIIEKDSVAAPANRAYGVDSGYDHTMQSQSKWMNVPTMREVLASLPVKWKFIFFDCCSMLNAEVAYELREQTDYIIGSPAEIPGRGAPYSIVVKDLFNHDDVSMYTDICTHCNAQVGDYIGQHAPMAVVKTDAIVPLAEATRQVLPQVDAYLKSTSTATEGAIYYYAANPSAEKEKTLYDMQDIIQTALKDDPSSYQTWHNAFQKAVVYSIPSTYWQANYVRFSDFTEMRDGVQVFKHGDDCCGVMSMFFPMAKYSGASHDYNEGIKQLGWYYAVGWSRLGW